MKNTLLILITFLITLSQTHAQDSKGHFGISFGGSFPLSDYASKDVNKEGAGWANPGLLGEITFGYKVGKGHFGLMASLRGQSCSMDDDGIEDELENLDPTTEWEVEAKSWRLGGLMFGGFASLPLSPKAYFEPRFMLGVMGAASPEYTITASDQTSSFWIKQSGASAVALAYLLGAGFKFDLGSTYLLANLDYLGMQPEFSNVEITASDGSKLKTPLVKK